MISTRVRYYVNADGDLFRTHRQQTQLFNTWADGWVPLLLPDRHFGRRRRIPAPRAWWHIMRRKVQHWRFLRTVGVR
jgi:hypothetical protein